jgi:hypothetical protein
VPEWGSGQGWCSKWISTRVDEFEYKENVLLVGISLSGLVPYRKEFKLNRTANLPLYFLETVVVDNR